MGTTLHRYATAKCTCIVWDLKHKLKCHSCISANLILTSTSTSPRF